MSESKSPDSLNDLMALIGQRYTFAPEHYPVLLTQRAPEQRQAFAVSHSVHHMMKAVGKISAECEAYDHGGAMNMEALKEATVKMIINTVKLAEELRMTGTDLCNAVPQFMRSK